jgi:hypothetical protein
MLQFCPEAPDEKDLRARFAKIGIAPEKEFPFEKLSEWTKPFLRTRMHLSIGRQRLLARKGDRGVSNEGI